MPLYQAIKKLLQNNPKISVEEIAQRVNISTEKAAIYILWYYHEKGTHGR